MLKVSPRRSSITSITLSSFSPHRAADRLRRHFQTAAVASLGLEDRPLAARATAAILEYVEETLPTAVGLLDRLVDSGKSVIVIEHHQAVMAHADWIIDLGPGAGHDGGRVVFEGTPADLVAAKSTLTGQHLAAYVGSP